MKKFILDSNVIMLSYRILEQKLDMLIPYPVFLELDNNKSTPGDAGFNSRRALLTIDKYAQKEGADLSEGIPNAAGGIIRIVSMNNYKPDISNDLNIVFTGKDYPEYTLLSNDRGVRILCNMHKVKCEEHINGNAKDFRFVHRSIELTDKDWKDLEANEEIDASGYTTGYFHNNEYFFAECSDGETMTAKFKELDYANSIIVKVPQYSDIWGISPRNDEQNILIDAINTSDVSIVIGPAGTGKTIIAVATALALTEDDGVSFPYHQLVLVKPVGVIGKDVGYLKGDLEEKTEGFFRSYEDNLAVIFDHHLSSSKKKKIISTKDGLNIEEKPYEYLFESGMVRFDTILNMRGRSLPNILLIIDEVQNLSKDQVKAIITRMGKGSKIILMGDPTQIDMLYLTNKNNGLSLANGRLKGQKIVSNVYLDKQERSAIAELGKLL